MKHTKLTTLFTLLLLLMIAGCKTKKKTDENSYSLIKGNTLDGWTQKGGYAKYTLEDGVVVGETVPEDSPNSFLTTNQLYDDFILELDYKVDPSMNSGIQIRSNSKPEFQDGRVHGYQVEIDPSDRSWSGGIYEEARRGWLVSLEENQTAREAFKQNEWNHVRVEAINDSLKVWLNDVPTAFLIDDETKTGFIALQVHRIKPEEKPGKKIMWKNIMIQTENLEGALRKMDLNPVRTKNNLTSREKENGWKMLWDGKSTNGWKGAKLDSFPNEGWVIEDGHLTVLSTGGKESDAGGDIVTEKLYKDFELKVDFQLTKGANSGIKYYVDTDLNKGPGSSIGLEYQILDDNNHPDAKLGNHEGSRTLASLYDLIQADVNKSVNQIGQWNSAHIISKNGVVTHFLNDKKVLEYDRFSENFKKLVSESKYDKWPDFGQLEKGQILLQDHGDRVLFKNIKIKEL
ncbi:3-keto-disaccharide hydrolase [Zunongwangia atlantica]|uniref:3-keto-alpha-glucoside-1,2-lyase/3-keto-2-hydroxy-glucal hydratase domain-containing protein n=1 Tax=Zunongwangia atlantica 22II14-10F7 TaxID=1185767 RepID=A0A1Y1T6W3_9FLAO|nr:DUF1080 domain-containing protein [Zunongwangia atlantica]ORL46153.1 hypothetical protein IIF7_06266 [Zunongwangia atlantica 22II14-10F7]|tara:strand:- start:16955 stop:18328 length:1374 start_codon:yes stop_codon:yes gene_type:complete